MAAHNQHPPIIEDGAGAESDDDLEPDPEPPPEPPRRGCNINWKWVAVGVGIGVGVGGLAVYYLSNRISDVEKKLIETKLSVQAAMEIERLIRNLNDKSWIRAIDQTLATIGRQLSKNTTDISQLQKTVDSLRENAMKFMGDMAKPQE